MKVKFDHKILEQKWSKEWEKLEIYKTPEISDKDKNKMYILDMFPYPSGAGLHVGHVEGYTATDIVSRFYRMNGKDVLHPIGWDAFGLPAENYAIKTGIHPRINTDSAIKSFKEQMNAVGLSYDWDREVGTHNPDYYKWTQWFFLFLYKRGLAYKKESPVNWCPKDQTVLANEQVVDGKCERCDTEVIQKNMSQWFFKITDYADRLIKDLDKVDWPESTKINQINWIGRSEGAEIEFKVENSDKKIKVFTTRLDTIMGCTFLVLSPEHTLIKDITTQNQREEVKKYTDDAKHKTELERTSNKQKSGVFTGSYAINPYNNELIPIWIGDFVISTYGTGALMAVPAHDERDNEFAQKFNLPVIDVITKYIGTKREDAKSRRVSYAVIFNPKTQKYGFQLWIKDDNCPSLPGGGLEENESFEQGLRRELKEEIGLENNYKIFPIGKFFSTQYSPGKQKHLHNEIEAYLVITEDKTFGELDKEAYENERGLEFKYATPNEFYNYAKKTSFPEKEYVEMNEAIMSKAIGLALDLGFDKNEENRKFITGLHHDYGILINSGEYNGLTSHEAYDKFVSIAEKQKFGNRKVNYRLRDWSISRQRYWGCPIPMVYDKDNNPIPVDEKDLPVILPDDVEFMPTGESPLKYHKGFQIADESKYGIGAKREPDTMDTFVDSSWYFFRFTDPHNLKEIASKEAMQKWAPIDIYVGGAEHTVLHLMYARFFTKVLFDAGLINFDEPFISLKHPGMILGEDTRKMSKRWGNVINPLDVINELGADALRMYEMFMGPFDQMKPWNTNTIQGIRRFLDRVYNLTEFIQKDPNKKIEVELNKLIKKVTQDIKDFKFNTAVSEFMKFTNTLEDEKQISKEQLNRFITLLAPFAPFMTEQLWHEINEENTNKSIHLQKWPEYDESLIQDISITLGIQVNGKIRGEIQIEPIDTEDSVKTKALTNSNVQKWIEGKEIKKFFYIKDKIISIVI